MVAPVMLAAVMLALWSGPVLYGLVRGKPRVQRAMDAVVLAGIALLILLEAGPDMLRAGGLASVAFLLAGLFGPTLLEHLFKPVRHEAHIGALVLAFGGLVLHTLADGAVLAAADSPADLGLALAIVLHSIPLSAAVWWLLAPPFGARWPSAVLLAMCAGTAAGYGLGVTLEHMLGPQAWAWVQALVAGSILHVILGRPHLGTGHGHAHQ